VRLSLRGQILLYTITAILLAVGTLSLFTLIRDGIREKEISRLDALSKAETFSSILINEGYLSNQDRLNHLIHVNIANKRILAIRFYDSNGQIIAEESEPNAENPEVHSIQFLQQLQGPEANFTDDSINVIQPMKDEKGVVYGYLEISSSLKSLNDNLSSQFHDILWGLLICLFFAIIATIIFSSWIIKPLRELMDKANRIIQGESVPLTLDRQDEIGSLGLSLNTMLRYINNRDEKLRQLASSLELKVVQRTEELASALNKAEAATEAKATFLASMTHELRTPMNGVIGTASLMADSELTTAQREQLDIIRNCGDHLLMVINDILDYSKIEALKMELEYAPLDLKKLIKEILNITKPMTDAKDLLIESFVDENAPAYIEGDVVRLRQVLVNLVSNAIKFTHNGGIYISVNPTSKNTLEFSIRDTGIGIAPNVQKKLFSAFTQADSSTTRQYGGTGLGLVISKKLVELMGGNVSVKSQVGEGSVFTFSIQAKPLDAMPAEIEQNVLPFKLAEEKPMDILLAEDNLVNQMVAKGFLQKLGYIPDVVNNGYEAVQALKNKDYDLIFMDMMMPVMDGLEASRIICASKPAHQRPWIIAMTANALEEHKQQCLQAGMNDFLTKPYTIGNLQTALLAAPSVVRHKKIVQGSDTPIIIQEDAKVSHLEEKSPTSYAAIDRQKLFDNFKDDEDLVPFAIQAFMKDYPQRIKDIEQSIENDNADQLAMAAHTLKGAVSNFYAKGAVDCAAIIEKNAKEKNFEQANQNFQMLKAELKKVHQELETLLAEIS
jgi:signal transduction histidine kinase/CheY-like chemotaxis protein/HPt (histidine-containing phosphotransfer) domain-containing protein